MVLVPAVVSIIFVLVSVLGIVVSIGQKHSAYYSEGNYKLSIEYLDKAKELGATINPKIAEQLQPYR